jgi:hypothetical protein
MRWTFLASFSVIALFLGSDSVSAQSSSADDWRSGTRVQGGVDFMMVTATGEFGKAVPDGAFGFMGHGDVGLGRSVFSVGGEAAWLQYGRLKRTVALAPLVPELPEAEIDIETLNVIASLHARLRAQRRSGRWRPYVDGLFGLMCIFTESTIEGDDWSDFETHASDFVLSRGGGAGVMIGTQPHGPKLDIGVRYVQGGTATYLPPGETRREGDRLSRDVVRSRTDTISVYLGVAFGR